jgi:arginine decarboxylase
MKFHFPIIIIDEDFRSGNASGFGIHVLAEVIGKEGMEVLGVTSRSGMISFARRQIPRAGGHRLAENPKKGLP